MKKFVSLTMIGLGMLTLSACGSASEDATDENTVVIGLDDTFAPMGFKDDAGEITGFDVDLAKAVFALSDKDVQFQPIDWSMKETELENGTIDLIWNGYSKTAEREKDVLFSETYMTNDQVLVTTKDSDITSFDAMDGKLLGAQEGSSGYDLFEDQPAVLKENVQDNTATLYASFNEAFIDLNSGRIDGLLIDKIYADYYLNQKDALDDYNIVTGPFESEDYAVGGRKDDEDLINEVNEGIDTLKENGEFKEISEKWFGEDVSAE
ncbi:MAG: amino acid ABC transporter substrate-binding protein [Enterococcus sp.]